MKETTEAYSKGKATLVEVGERMEEHKTVLASTLSEGDSIFDQLTTMLADLAKVRASPAAVLYDTFADRLLAKAVSEWRRMETHFASPNSEPSAACLESLDKFAAEASIAFSLDDSVAEMKEAIGHLTQSASTKARIRAVGFALDGSWDAPFDSQDFAKKVAETSAVLDKYEGLALPIHLQDLALERFEELGILLVSRLGRYTDQLHIDATIHCWTKLSMMAGAPPRATNPHRLAMALHTGVKVLSMAVITDTNAAAATIHELGVSVAKTSAIVDINRRNDEPLTELQNMLLACADDFLAKSRDVISNYQQASLDTSVSELKAMAAKCKERCNGYEVRDDGIKWCKDVKGTSQAAWQKLVAAATDTIFKLDTAALEKDLTTMSEVLGRAREAFTLCGPPKAETAVFMKECEASFMDMHVLLRSTLIAWCCVNEDNHERARQKLRTEVKALRLYSDLKESELLAPALFKKVMATLSASSTST